MKKYLRLLILLMLSAVTTSAQMNLEYFGSYTSSASSSYAGWGGGMNILSAPVGMKFKSGIYPLNVQLGGGFYFVSAGQQQIDGVIVQEKEMDLSFNNTQVNGYGLARFTSSPGINRMTLYIDLFAGVRAGTASMLQHTCDHETCESIMLHRSFGLSGGFGTGMLIPVSKNIKLDLGMQWQRSTTTGKFVDMQSVKNTGDGIVYRMENVPVNLFSVKLGVQVRFNKSACCSIPGCKIPGHHPAGCAHSHGDFLLN